MMGQWLNVKVIWAFLLGVIMSACTSSASSPTLTPQILDSITPEIRTPTSIPATSQQSPTRTPTFQPSRTPSATPHPSQTPTISQPTRTLPANPQATLTQQAFEMRATQIASFPATCGDFGEYDTSLSPSGNWLAIHCGYKRNQTLEIVSKEGKQWVLQFRDYLAEEFLFDDSTPMGGLYPAHWTKDETYLYFVSYIAWDGGGTCFYGFGFESLHRLDVNTGAVSVTLPAGRTLEYEIAFSPRGRFLAYNALQTAVLDLRTGEEFIIEDRDDLVIGNLIWSPDGSELAYATCQATEDHSSIVKSTVRIYTLETRTSRTILEVEKNLLSIELWDGSQLLRITNDDFQINENSYLFFDWSSRQLATATPTPQPK